MGTMTTGESEINAKTRNIYGVLSIKSILIGDRPALGDGDAQWKYGDDI